MVQGNGFDSWYSPDRQYNSKCTDKGIQNLTNKVIQLLNQNHVFNTVYISFAFTIHKYCFLYTLYDLEFLHLLIKFMNKTVY